MVAGDDVARNGVDASGFHEVEVGGRLQGFGKVANLTPHAVGCLIAPGTSPGILTCSNFNAAGTGSGFLQIEMSGTAPGAGYDQLDVRGTANLTGLTLFPILTFPSALSNQLVIINNDGADAVIGTSNGWPPNSVLTINGEQFRISYNGGTGDVVLMQLTANARPALSIQRISASVIHLSWPTNSASGFNRQTNANLAATNWNPATPPAPVIIGTNYVVTNSFTGSQKFYRLFKP